MSMSQFEAFLTCEPNPLVVPIHPKAVPVILHPDDYDRWLATMLTRWRCHFRRSL